MVFPLLLKFLIPVDLLYIREEDVCKEVFCFPFVKIYFEKLTRAQSTTLQISFFLSKFPSQKAAQKNLRKKLLKFRH